MKKPIIRVADLRQQVYESLKTRIIEGGFAVDTRFQEIALAQELGVSRTPVREALAMLVRDGLLVQAIRGFVFPRFSPQDMTESIEIRLLLEPYAIRRMVEDNPPEAMRALGQQMHQILDDTGTQSSQYLEAHRAAREAMYGHMRNGQLVETLRRFEDRVHYMRLATLRDPDIREISHTGMMRLADAIQDADADRAQAQMRRQLMNALQAFLDICTRDSSPSDPMAQSAE
ncbi:MAG: GntR family transcriptional regulator [Paracoccaceae bacterium]